MFGHQIEAEADGSFELFIGGELCPGNWLPTTEGSRKLLSKPEPVCRAETSPPCHDYICVLDRRATLLLMSLLDHPGQHREVLQRDRDDVTDTDRPAVGPEGHDLVEQLDAVGAQQYIITVPDAYSCFRRHFDYNSGAQTFLK